MAASRAKKKNNKLKELQEQKKQLESQIEADRIRMEGGKHPQMEKKTIPPWLKEYDDTKTILSMVQLENEGFTMINPEFEFQRNQNWIKLSKWEHDLMKVKPVEFRIKNLEEQKARIDERGPKLKTELKDVDKQIRLIEKGKTDYIG